MKNLCAVIASIFFLVLCVCQTQSYALQTSAQIKITCTVLPQPANLSVEESTILSLSAKSPEELQEFADEKGIDVYRTQSDDMVTVKFTKTA